MWIDGNIDRTHILLCDRTFVQFDYCQLPNIKHTLVVDNIIDRSDVVGASPVGAAPTTSSFST